MDNHLQLVKFLVNLMDDKFTLGKFSFGLDPLLDIIPWFGDIFGALVAFYIVWVGIQYELPQAKVSKMIGNIIADFLLGLIPVVGIVFDATFKANKKNLKIIEEHLGIGKIVQEAHFVN